MDKIIRFCCLIGLLTFQGGLAHAFTKEQCEFFYLDRYFSENRPPQFQWECQKFQERLDRSYSDITKKGASDLNPNTKRVLYRRFMALSGCDEECELLFLKEFKNGKPSPQLGGRCSGFQDLLDHIHRDYLGKKLINIKPDLQSRLNFRLQELEDRKVLGKLICLSGDRPAETNPVVSANLAPLANTSSMAAAQLGSADEDNQAVTKSYRELMTLATPEYSISSPTSDSTLINRLGTISRGMPKFMDSPKVFENFYKDSEVLGSGGFATVYKRTVRFDRPVAGLAKGTPMAVRVKPVGHDVEAAMWVYGGIRNPALMAKLSALGTAHGMRVTDYFPEFYGAYYGRSDPGTNFRYKSDTSAPSDTTLKVPTVYLYQEMELVDTDFEREYANKKIPDSVIFELCLGEWAGERILGIKIPDFKGRNLGLKKVGHYRIYHIGKNTYAFPPGMTPRRLDIEGTSEESMEWRLKVKPSCTVFGAERETENAKKMLEEPDMFDGFSKHFTKYKITPQEVESLKKDYEVREYYIDPKYFLAQQGT